MIGRVPTSARLRLRALGRKDVSLIRALYCNASTMRHIGRPLSRAVAAAAHVATLAAMRKPDGPRFLVIIERNTARCVGLCSIRQSPDPRCPEIGIMLLAGARRRGYACEALGVLIDAAFEKLPITAVLVQYRRANTASARLFDALGFPRRIQLKGAKRGLCVRTLRRPLWRKHSQLKTHKSGVCNVGSH